MVAGSIVQPIHKSPTNIDSSSFSSDEDTLRVPRTTAAAATAEYFENVDVPCLANKYRGGSELGKAVTRDFITKMMVKQLDAGSFVITVKGFSDSPNVIFNEGSAYLNGSTRKFEATY